jgi:PAS domain S-box-containing protein
MSKNDQSAIEQLRLENTALKERNKKLTDKFYGFRQQKVESRQIRDAGNLRKINDQNNMLTAGQRSCETLFWSLLENTSAVVSIKDMQTRYLLVNKRWKELFELNADDVVGKTSYEVMPRETAKVFEDNDQMMLETRFPQRVEEVFFLGEKQITTLSTLFPLRDVKGNMFAMCCWTTDITERKRIQDELNLGVLDLKQQIENSNRALEQSEMLYRTMVELQSEIVYRWNLTGEITYVNEACCGFYEKQKGDLIGKRIQSVTPYFGESELSSAPNEIEAFIHEDDCDRARAYINTISPKNPKGTCEHRVVLPSGDLRWLQWNDRIIFDNEGNALEVLSVGRDITIRKLMEEKVRGSNAQLHLLANKLITAQEDERRRISQDLHDEVGQIMTGLTLSLNKIRSELQPDEGGLRRRLVETIEIAEMSMDRLRQLAHSLRPPSLDSMPFPAVLENLCQAFSREADIKVNISVNSELPDLPEMYKITLYRIAQESLTNAAKHANTSAVWVTLDYEDGVISLAVEDDGLGFIPTELSSGIGLQGLRERLTLFDGGYLEIDSAPGQGTRLIGFLPLGLKKERQI